ncbi:MAG: GEVED domain-containing protein [Ferruginibacter sp.]
MRKILLNTVLLCSFIVGYAQTGELDASFGTGGIVTTNAGSAFGHYTRGQQVLLQTDGSMFMVYLGPNQSTVITKKNADGTTDLSYGTNGYSAAVGIIGRAVRQPDGKIIVAGYARNSTVSFYNSTDIALVRFNANGTLDNSFGVNGIVTEDFGIDESASGVALQPDGKIVISVNTLDPSIFIPGMMVMRYNPNGTRDNTFSGDGMADFDFGNSDQLGDVAVLSTGKILLCGSVLFRLNSDGTLDTGFDEDGRVETGGFAGNMIIQPDNKILMSGYYYVDASNTGGFAARYNSDGTPDNNFDGDGTVLVAFGGTNESLGSMQLQSNGNIILAGYTSSAPGVADFAVARFTSTGSPDNTFSGDGKLTINFGPSSSGYYGASVAVQSNGAVIILGYGVNGTNSSVAAARVTVAGAPDNTFSGDGFFTENIVQGSTNYTCTAAQPDGKVVTAGYTWNGASYDFIIARYNYNGTLDNTFSGDGLQITSLSAADDKAYAIKILTTGKILVAGAAGTNVGLAQYNSDGTLDNTFDGDGIKVSDFGTTTDVARALAVQTDGKIIIAGSVVARYNSDGTTDNTFSGDGRLDGASNAYAVALQADGKIVFANNGTVYGDLFVYRYNSDGTPDNTFGEAGDGSVPFYVDDIGLYDVVRAIVIQPDGKIVLGGYYEYTYRATGAQFRLTRLNSNGTLDNTFAGGRVTQGINQKSYGTSLALQPDNKILFAGYAYNGTGYDFTVLRYNTNGTLDQGFSGDGIQVTHLNAASSQVNGLAVYDNKLYAAGFGEYPGTFGAVARYYLCTSLDPGCYAPVTCTSSGTRNIRGYINRVFFRNIANESGWNGGYGNYQYLVAPVKRKASYTMTIVPGFTGFPGFTLYTRAWADWNQDGDFDDAGELIFSPAASSRTVTGMTVAVPSTARFGKTKLRIAMRQGTAPTTCGTFEFGEVEDYTLLVESPVAARPGRDTDNANEIDITANSIRYKIYPNPVSANLIIMRTDAAAVSSAKLNTQLSFTDAMGRLVLSKTLNDAIEQVDVGKLANGVYVMRLQNGNSTTVQKVIVNH